MAWNQRPDDLLPTVELARKYFTHAQFSIHARDVARAIATTPGYVQSRHRRKKVEMLFAHLKRILRMARLRLRGPRGARDAFLLAATAQNLRRLAKLRPRHGVIAA